MVDQLEFGDLLQNAHADHLMTVTLNGIIGRHQNHEFITAITGADIVIPYATFDALGNMLEYLITYTVAIGIVNLFKIIQIDKAAGEGCRDGCVWRD